MSAFDWVPNYNSLTEVDLEASGSDNDDADRNSTDKQNSTLMKNTKPSDVTAWIVVKDQVHQSNKKILYTERLKKLKATWKVKKTDNQKYMVPRSLHMLGEWLLMDGQIKLAKGDLSGWQTIAEAYQLYRAALIANVWSRFHQKDRTSMVPLQDGAHLLIFAHVIGDKKFEKFCEKLIGRFFADPQLFSHTTGFADMVALLLQTHRKRPEKHVLQNAKPFDYEQELIDKWQGRGFKQALLDYLDARFAGHPESDIETQCFFSGFLNCAPFEVNWMMDLRKQQDLPIPRIKHFLLDDNPLTTLPIDGLQLSENEVVEKSMDFLRKISGKEACVLELKLPK